MNYYILKLCGSLETFLPFPQQLVSIQCYWLPLLLYVLYAKLATEVELHWCLVVLSEDRHWC